MKQSNKGSREKTEKIKANKRKETVITLALTEIS